MLHVLTARLDRAADRVLQGELGVTYRRVLALTLVGELGASNQRELAEALGVTEPSVSRMVAGLVGDGQLDVQPHPSGGRSRQVQLTAAGEELVAKAQRELEYRFMQLVEASGIPYHEYEELTARLLTTLEEAQDVQGGSA